MSSETSTSSPLITTGGVAAEHIPLPLPEALVAPAHSGSEHNAFRSSIIPFACWRAHDLRFKFESSFVLPGIASEIVVLKEMMDRHTLPDDSGQPKHKPALTIFGHADPTGSDDFNKSLSGRRAQAVYGMLIRKTDLWEDLYSNPLGNDKWEPEAIHTMQSTLGQPISDKPSHSARKALFKTYMDHVCSVPGDSGQPASFELKPGDFLADGADAQGKGDYQGCGEFNPLRIFSEQETQRFADVKNKGERDEQNAPNRRVLIFLFRPGVRIKPEDWPCPRAKEGAAACKQRFWSDGEKRRTRRLPDARRDYEETFDTFACRFYDRLSNHSPCERIIPQNRWIIRVDKKQGLQPGDTVTLESKAVGYKSKIAARDAIDLDAFLDFLFPIGPESDYDVTVTVGSRSYFAWEGLHLPSPGQGLENSPIRYAADGDQHTEYRKPLARGGGPSVIV
jgi:hypothetical protein